MAEQTETKCSLCNGPWKVKSITLKSGRVVSGYWCLMCDDMSSREAADMRRRLG